MANNSPAILYFGRLTTALLLGAMLVSLPKPAFGTSATKYKKNTVVDFEEALVEGKSRKPYSAYLYKQKQQATADLSQWTIDITKGMELSQARVSE